MSRLPASVIKIPGITNLPAIRSAVLTPLTTKERGRAIIMSDLHCGHWIFAGARVCRLAVGASRSATQSRRQDSWAVSAQGQGDRQADEVGVSSVSSAKQIQHFRGSSAEDCCCGEGDFWIASVGEAGVDDLLRTTVWESSEDSEGGGLRGRRRSAWRNSGADSWRRAPDCCRGCDAMVMRGYGDMCNDDLNRGSSAVFYVQPSADDRKHCGSLARARAYSTFQLVFRGPDLVSWETVSSGVVTVAYSSLA